MKVAFTDKAKQWGEGFALLQHATKRLEEEVVGPSAATAEAKWDRTEDEGGRPLYALTLSDHGVTVREEFTPEELRSDSRMYVELTRLWGDLLQEWSHRLFRELQGAGQPEG
jgi:hypothetical protein